MSERIGVYICHCGTNIAKTVDVAAVAEFARTLPDVAVVREYKYMCSDPGQEMIKQDVEKDKLTRVVVSSCSPLMHENTFRTAVQDAGLNRFLFQMSNIREQCSWVHDDREQATEKAKRLLAGAVNRVKFHRELEGRRVPVAQSAVVVGAGVAGIEAALKMADAGKKVYLVEKQPSIGGHMAMFDKTFPTLDCAACILTPKMVSVGQHPNIELLSYSEIEDVGGFVGNFKLKVRRRSRYIDEKKCTGCGSCVERCPVKFNPTDNGHKVAVEMNPEMKRRVDRIVDTHRHERGPLVLVLQDINHELGYLPRPALKYVAAELGMSLSKVYHVATFYKSFSLTPRGEHLVRVCMGTACHVRGAARVLEALESRLGLSAGQTSEDLKFTLETVNCLGACAMGPVVVMDDRYYTVTPAKVDRLIRSVEKGQVKVAVGS
jgi:NADH:ubiquinone oxidoreductase subunit E/NAD-dependent dihydropyrimidine dehydrogenase PreA subunit